MARRKNPSRLRSTTNPNPNPNLTDIVTLENNLFREASNLSAATGASVALISRRPTGEVRVWGYPSPRSVITRYQRYRGRRIVEEAAPAPEMVLAAEERARPYVEFRRREEEINGRSRTPAEWSAVEQEWMIEFLGREIDRVQKRIEELVAAGGEAEKGD